MADQTSLSHPCRLKDYLHEIRKSNYARATQRLHSASKAPPCIYLKTDADDDARKSWDTTVTTHDLLIHVDSSRFAEHAEDWLVIPAVSDSQEEIEALNAALPLLAALLAGFVPDIEPRHLPAIIHACSFIGAERLLTGLLDNVSLDRLSNEELLVCIRVLTMHGLEASNTSVACLLGELSKAHRMDALLTDDHWEAIVLLAKHIASFFQPASVQSWLNSLPDRPQAAALALTITYGCLIQAVATLPTPAQALPKPDTTPPTVDASSSMETDDEEPTDPTTTTTHSTSSDPSSTTPTRPSSPPATPTKAPESSKKAETDAPPPTVGWEALFERHCTVDAIAVLPDSTIAALLEHAAEHSTRGVRAVLHRVVSQRASTPPRSFLAILASELDRPNVQGHGKLQAVTLQDSPSPRLRLVWMCPAPEVNVDKSNWLRIRVLGRVYAIRLWKFDSQANTNIHFAVMPKVVDSNGKEAYDVNSAVAYHAGKEPGRAVELCDELCSGLSVPACMRQVKMTEGSQRYIFDSDSWGSVKNNDGSLIVGSNVKLLDKSELKAAVSLVICVDLSFVERSSL